MGISLKKGWNTFFTDSLFCHAKLPDGFGVNLCFKDPGTGRVLRDSFFSRWEGGCGESVRADIRGLDGSYTRLTLSWNGSETVVESAADGDSCVLLITPVRQGKLPLTLLAVGTVLWNRPVCVRRVGDTLEAETETGLIRVYACGSRTEDPYAGLGAPYLALSLGRPAVISMGTERSEEEAREIVGAARERLLQEHAAFGGLCDAYAGIQSAVGWNTVYEPEEDTLFTGVSRKWNAANGGYMIFCWDTFFAAVMAGLFSPELACENFRAVLTRRTEEGFVPNFASPDGMKSRDRSEPPVGALALRMLAQRFGEEIPVREFFPALLEWNRWYAGHRMLQNGWLCWGSDPYEPRLGRYWEKNGVGAAFGAALESGMDNSPMYDGVPFDEERHIHRQADVGLTSLYFADCTLLADFAAQLGKFEEEAELRGRAARCAEGLSELWNGEAGIFCNRRTDTGEWNLRLSPTSFYPLFSGKVTAAQAERMLREHLYNPEEFWGEYVLPTIARNDPAYPEQDYWRGRIWGPSNFLTYLALRAGGQEDAARELAQKSLDLFRKEWRENCHTHENYNAELGIGCDSDNSDNFYTWGALLALPALMEDGKF